MVNRIKNTQHGPSTTWIDPAQGSGAFLRAILALADDYEVARNGLYGVDIDPFAAEVTSFVLTAEDLIIRPEGEPPGQRWHHFRRNFATLNSMFLDARAGLSSGNISTLWDDVPARSVSELFPEIGSAGFSRVIANPPYAKLTVHADNTWLSQLHPVTGASASADISPVFVELGLRLLAEDGAMIMVLPLSHVVSSRAPFPALRAHLSNERGRVDFEAFDRVPDALFGDDIKTRNAIITIDRSAMHDVTTTRLRRWTSRRRERAFTGVQRVSALGVPGSPAVLPKIGTEWERELYLACIQRTATISSWVKLRRSIPLASVQEVDSPHWSQLVAIAPTAYNFLGITRDATQAARDGHDSENAVSLLWFESAQVASAAYALFASRVAFWLWHVTGDGFHTTAKLPLYIPSPTDSDALARLAVLGEELWKLARESPLISRNRGKTTSTYPTWMYRELLGRIDREVDLVLGTSAAENLAAWHEELVVVDTESDRVEMILRKTK